MIIFHLKCYKWYRCCEDKVSYIAIAYNVVQNTSGQEFQQTPELINMKVSRYCSTKKVVI